MPNLIRIKEDDETCCHKKGFEWTHDPYCSGWNCSVLATHYSLQKVYRDAAGKQKISTSLLRCKVNTSRGKELFTYEAAF